MPARSCSPIDSIVLVHGFHGHPTGTWTHEESNKCWPKDHVPDAMKAHTRVLTFAYNTSHTRPYRREELSDHSRGLLKRLNKCPQRRQDGLRPIVWVAHSAGGIIVKEALIIARHSRQFRDIFYSTYGVVRVFSHLRPSQFAQPLTPARRSSLLPLIIAAADRGAKWSRKFSTRPLASGSLASSQTHAGCWTRTTPKGWTTLPRSSHPCPT